MTPDKRYETIEHAVEILKGTAVPTGHLARFASAIAAMDDALDWLAVLRGKARRLDEVVLHARAYRHAQARGAPSQTVAYHGAALDRACDGD